MNEYVQKLGDYIISKKQISDTIYSTIRECIAQGILPAGTRLREEDIAEVFDASRTPAREALRRLEIENIIETSSTQGSVVRTIPIQECLDALDVLELIRHAAARTLMGHIPRTHFLMLEQNIQKGSKLKDASAQYENNAEFHDLIVDATGNIVLKDINQRLCFMERLIAATVFCEPLADDYCEHHRAMVQAIMDNDTELLEKELAHSREKVDAHMNAIVGAFFKEKE